MARYPMANRMPRPSSDPQDPLRWPQWQKMLALVAAASVNFAANFAGAGLSVAIPVLMVEFESTAPEINKMLSFYFLLLGIGNLFWVPLAAKLGKRACLLTSSTIFLALLLWTPKTTTKNGLLAARCLSGFASAAGESLVPSIVTDLFYLDEHAAMMSIYIIFITTGTSFGPLIGGFIVARSSQTWRTFAWVSAGVAGITLLLVFFFFPETTWDRLHDPRDDEGRNGISASESITEVDRKSDAIEKLEQCPPTPHYNEQDASRTHPIPFLEIWGTFIRRRGNLTWTSALFRPWTIALTPHVLWASLFYAAMLAPQLSIGIAFAPMLMAPPYLWPALLIGLMQIPSIIGFVVACFGGGWLADVVWLLRLRHVEDKASLEQRLFALLPAFWVGPAGCILTAFACGEQLHWVAIAFGYFALSFGTVYGPNIVVTYLAESFPMVAAEALVAVNALKNALAFILVLFSTKWTESQGYVQVYMVMFAIQMVVCILALPFYFRGDRLAKRSHELWGL